MKNSIKSADYTTCINRQGVWGSPWSNSTNKSVTGRIREGNAPGRRIKDFKPRARIQINAATQSEGLMGKTNNGYVPHSSISEITDKPPDYNFVIFHKSRPEVLGSRTAGATDQTFLPERVTSGTRQYGITAPMSPKYQIVLSTALLLNT
jgi:hypothetical protein